MRRVMLPLGIAVAVLAAIAGAWMVFGGEPIASPTVTASPTVVASPTGGATPEPSPPVDGAIPVPALLASAIPWDEVGPGWFLVSYDPDTADDVVPAQTMGPNGLEHWFSLADESLQLVSPTGDLYYVRDLDGLGSVLAVAWTGDSVLVLEGHAIAESGQTPYGRLDAIDLGSGAATTLNDEVVMFDGSPRLLADGRIVTWGSGEGAMWISVHASDFSVPETVCSSDYGAVSTLSPDGTQVVCLETDYPKSAVMQYDILDGSSAQIDTFTYLPYEYTMHGWWDANSFAVTRVEAGTTLSWAYDVSTQQIRDLNATLSGGTPAESAEGIAGYRVVSAGTTVEVQGFDGSLRATLPCYPDAISGSLALTVCGDPGAQIEISVTDLESGEVTSVATFDSGADALWAVIPWLG